MKHYFQFIPHILIAVGIFFLGVFSGLIYNTSEETLHLTPITTIEKENLSVLELTEVTPFGIKGKTYGNSLRISTGHEILEMKKNEEFQINTRKLYRNIQAVIPKEIQFFVSRRGSIFYSIEDTKKLEDIRPENLMFFVSAVQAEEAGYKEEAK